MHCRIWDENRTWYDNVELPCETCFNEINSELEQRICSCSGELHRIGKSVAHKKNICICCSTSECKNNKRFVEKFSLIKSEIPFLMTFMKEMEQKYAQIEREKYSQIVHNLKSLNAQSISTQSLFIPQDLRHNKYRNLFSIVEDKVKSNPREATITLLKLAKNNNHVKTEFSTHEKLSFENPVLFKQFHNITTVILNVYHSFDMEFKEKGINLVIEDNGIVVNFDFDTIRVALYHIFSNAIKYMKPNTNLEVVSSIGEDCVDVVFSMTSMHIQPGERDKIFNDHYSGIQAVEHKLNGHGLGLGYIRKAALLNGGEFKVIAGNKTVRANGINYSNNQFVLRFSAL